jgi:hypothetical protein
MVDLRFTGSTNDNSLRELSTMVAFHLLLKNSSQYSNWQQLEKILQMFVGMPDSLNFSQLNDLMTAAGIVSPANVPNSAALQNLQAQLMSGQLGVQNIQNGYFIRRSPVNRSNCRVPLPLWGSVLPWMPGRWANVSSTRLFGIPTASRSSAIK